MQKSIYFQSINISISNTDICIQIIYYYYIKWVKPQMT